MNPVYLEAIKALESGAQAQPAQKPVRLIPRPKRPPRTKVKVDGKALPMADGLDLLTKRLASYKPGEQEAALNALLRAGRAAKGHPVVDKVRALHGNRGTATRVRVGTLLVLVSLSSPEEQDRLLAEASKSPSQVMRQVATKLKRDVARARELGIDRAPTSDELVAALRSGDPDNRSRAMLHISMRGKAMDKDPAMKAVVGLFMQSTDPSVRARALGVIVRVRGGRANPYLYSAYKSGDLLLHSAALRLGKTVGWSPRPAREVDFPGKERATKQ